MPYRFDVTEGEKKVFGHACSWAETHLPELVEAGRSIDGKVSGMVAAGHEDRPGYLLGAIALSYADSLTGDPGAGFDAMLAAERAAAAKRVILLAWLLIAEDSSAGAKITPLAVLPWSPYKGRWLAQSTAFRDRTATWTKLIKTAMEVVATVESGIAVHTGASKRFAVAFSFPGEKRDYVKATDECLTKSLPKESVFYDNRFKAELARPNLDTHLQDIYSNAELVVVFLCADYRRKPWCGLEWRSIRAMIGKKLDAKIMLFRFDNAKVDGTFDIDGYIDAGTHPPEEAVKLILQRLGSNRRQARGSRKRKPQRH